MLNPPTKLTWSDPWLKLQYYFFLLWLFLIPSNLFLVVSENWSYLRGLQLDYLILKLYASTLAALGVIILQRKWPLSHRVFWAGVVVVLFQLETALPLVGIWGVATLAVSLGMIMIMRRHKNWLWSRATQLTLLGTVLLQSLVGLVQFFSQKSVANYWFLGETDLSHYANIAKGSFGGEELILAYGTTPHPNVLAGFLVLTLLIVVRSRIRFVTPLVVTLGLMTLFTTQSVAGFMALVMGGGVLLIQPYLSTKIMRTIFILCSSLLILIPLLLAQIPSDSPSIIRRVRLNQAAISQLEEHPYLGVGVGQFTASLDSELPSTEFAHFLQPAHHVFLLMLAELGIAGFSLVLAGVALAFKKTYRYELLIAALPLLALDHYLYSLVPGLGMMALVGVFSLRNKTTHIKPD